MPLNCVRGIIGVGSPLPVQFLKTPADPAAVH